MRIYVQTRDRARINILPFFEVYETMMPLSVEGLEVFRGHLKVDFPKAKRILVLLTKRDFDFSADGVESVARVSQGGTK